MGLFSSFLSGGFLFFGACSKNRDNLLKRLQVLGALSGCDLAEDINECALLLSPDIREHFPALGCKSHAYDSPILGVMLAAGGLLAD